MVLAHKDLCYLALALKRGYLGPKQFAELVSAPSTGAGEDFPTCLLNRNWITQEQKQELDLLVVEDSTQAESHVPADQSPHQASTSVHPSDSNYDETLCLGESEPGALRYMSMRPLASGGLGRVSIARDLELQREVALKELKTESQSSAAAVERFVSEARITGGLEHPGIVPVYGLEASNDGQPRYAMRLIRGRSLQDAVDEFHRDQVSRRMQSGDEEFRRLLRSLMDACNAVAYANSRGVIHRDIKPQNIMLGKFGETLVVDWGLAKVIQTIGEDVSLSEMPMQDDRSEDSNRTSMGSVLGTPSFMSPEQAAGRLDRINTGSDVFGLGATLFAILTGRSPYQGSSREAILQAAVAGDFPEPRALNPAVPSALSAICCKAMAKQPEERYRTPIELAADLDRWIAGQPVSAMAEPYLAMLFRKARSHQTVVAATAGMVAVALIASLVANWAISKQRNLARQERDVADAMRAEAEQQRQIAEELQETATREAQRAERNSAVALEIVDSFVKELADTRWSEFPRFDKQRLQMVDLAVEECSELLQADPTNAELKTRVVQVLIRSSNLHRIIGDRDLSQARIERALELIDTIADRAENENRAGLLSDALNSAAANVNSLDGAMAALDISEREILLAKERLNGNPHSANAQIALARALLQYAEICLNIRRPASARLHAEESLPLLEELVAKFKTVFPLHIFHSYSYLMIGEAHLMDEDFEHGRVALEKSIQLGRIAKELFPENNNVTDFAQKAVIALAKLEQRATDKAAGLEALQESLLVYRQLADLHPDVEGYARSQAEIHNLLAAEHYRLGRLSEAARQAQQAEDLLDGLLEDGEIPPIAVLDVRIATRAVLLLTPAASKEDRVEFVADIQRLRQANPQQPVLHEELVQLALEQNAASEITTNDPQREP